MKKILLLFTVLILILVSCRKVDKIQSLDQLEPFLCQYVGMPSQIDTLLENKKLFIKCNSIHYQYEEDPKVTFEQLVSLLSKAYGDKPVYEHTINHRFAGLIPVPNSDNVSTIQIEEWTENGKVVLIVVSILDINNELATPSSPALQTVVPSK